MLRFISLIIGSFLALFMILASARFWGQGQTYLPYENRFYTGAKPWVVVPWEQSFFLEKKPDLILWANVYQAGEDQILVAPSAETRDVSQQRDVVSSPARPPLADLIAKFPQSRFILNILDNKENIHQRIFKVLEKEANSERFLIQSDYNVVLTSIKSLLPRLVYGSTQADLMRFKSFQGMWILPATPFKGDAFITPLHYKERETINQEIKEELERRHKPLILGPLHNEDDVKQALSLGSEGLYVEKPEWALQWMSETTSE